MYHKYGELFFDCFYFDETRSTVKAGGKTYLWSDTLPGDSVQSYDFVYRFCFPGSASTNKTSWQEERYKPKEDSAGRLVVDTMRYPWKCRTVSREKMEQLTKKELGQPLSECTVTLWAFPRYVSDHGKTVIGLDSSHFYFMIVHATSKRGLIYRRIRKVTERSVLVDGCTGAIVRPVRKHKRIVHPGKW